VECEKILFLSSNRRDFPKRCGKFAAARLPTISMFASLTSDAIVKSGYKSAKGVSKGLELGRDRNGKA